MTVIDFDDFCQGRNRLDLLWRLKEVRPDFKLTVFAIPSLGSSEFWGSVPPWIELAVHGWRHWTSRECLHWSYADMDKWMRMVHPRFINGFKAPGWQIPDDCYKWLVDHEWWVADQNYNDYRRPPELKVYKIDGWHGHTHDVCDNGIAETFDQVEMVVRGADEFKFASESLV